MNSIFVNFPKTNPIVFRKEGEYEPYNDAALREHKARFCQQFHEDDRISFQMRINKPTSGVGISIYFIVNDNEILFNTLSLGNFPTQIKELNDYEMFWFPLNVGTSNVEGVVGFSMKISDIIKKVNVITSEYKRLINDGDRFNIRIDVQNGEQFISNDLMCKNDTTGTKLIHYNYSDADDYLNYGTIFQKMIYGYDIRLKSEFLPLNQNANKEIMQNHDGSFTLISSLPYETVNLLVGAENGVGVPDWLIRNLNYIFHLDDKTIDEVPYELVEGSELEVEIVTGYNHRFLNIEIAKKEIEDWKLGFESQFVEQDPPNIFKEYEDNNKTTGTVVIKYEGDYYLRYAEGLTDLYTFSSLSGSGTERITFTADKNLTAETISTKIYVVDLATNTDVGDFTLELPPVNTGICFWKICENFHIAC